MVLLYEPSLGPRLQYYLCTSVWAYSWLVCARQVLLEKKCICFKNASFRSACRPEYGLHTVTQNWPVWGDNVDEPLRLKSEFVKQCHCWLLALLVLKCTFERGKLSRVCVVRDLWVIRSAGFLLHIENVLFRTQYLPPNPRWSRHLPLSIYFVLRCHFYQTCSSRFSKYILTFT